MKLKSLPLFSLLLATAFFCPGVPFGFAKPDVAAQVEFTPTFSSVGSAETAYFDDDHDGTATNIGAVEIAPIQIHVSAIDGVPVTEQYLGFCLELEQPISEYVTYTYTFVDDPAFIRLDYGGLSNTRVGQLEYLFDNYYMGSNLADWGTTGGINDEYIFQLAVWEITHDTDLSLSATGGLLYFTGSDPIVAEADSILGAMDSLGASYFDSYDATTWDINSLHSTDNQDLVYAELVPEPSSALLFMVGGIFFLLVRRPRQFSPGR